MDKVWLRRCASYAEEAEADAEFWEQLGADGRVAVTEQMRREHSQADEPNEPGLRRVVRVLRTS